MTVTIKSIGDALPDKPRLPMTQWRKFMLFESYENWVCTCPDPFNLPCSSDELLGCDECVYFMDADDLPEVLDDE